MKTKSTITMPSTPIAVDVSTVSAMTLIAVSTLNKWRMTGGGPPFVKVGRSVRYRVADLERWMADRLVSSTADVAAAAAREVSDEDEDAPAVERRQAEGGAGCSAVNQTEPGPVVGGSPARASIDESEAST